MTSFLQDFLKAEEIEANEANEFEQFFAPLLVN